MRNKIRNALDERGVSPVIGVILMVAITVILAAVIGSFVLGIGGDIEASPQASLSVDFANDEIAHQGGDTLDLTTIEITDGTNTYYYPNDFSSTHSDDELGPGETATLSSDISGSISVVHNKTGNVIFSTEE